MSESEKLLTAADIAQDFSVSERTVMGWAKEYAWPRTKVGRRFRWTPEQYQQILRLHAVTPAGIAAKDGRTARSARRAS